MENKKEDFSYTYSAQEQEEVKRIREKYEPREESKIEQLRRLDESVTRPGRIISLILGVVGTLMLGLGMCCVMEWNLFVLGIVIGIFGIVVVATAYPVYMQITKSRRQKLAPQILKLSEELMK